MKTFKYIIVLMMLLPLGSCKKFLTQTPVSQIADFQFYKSKYDVDAAMAGMYSGFQLMMVGEGGTTSFNDRYHYWGDFRSDTFDRFISYANVYQNEIAFNAITPDNPYSDWSKFYTVISRANNNIKYIPTVTAIDNSVTTDVVNADLAQSYAMRAMCYFYILRIWGDAPVWLEPYESISQEPEREKTTAASILNDIVIKDLTTAYSLTVKGQTASVFYINEASICANLADAYMWKKDYPNAIIWINNLFKAKNPKGALYAGTSDANLEPTATWKNVFTTPTASAEAIWSINWNYTNNGCSCMVLGPANNNKGMQLDPLFYASYFLPQTTATHTNDIRPKQTLDLYITPTNNRDRFVKFAQSPVNPTAASTAADLAIYYAVTINPYLPMYRLGDIYLLYAEALNGNNDLPNALKYLNYIRKRASLVEYLPTDPLVNNKASMENTILQERMYELVGEGKRWFDLIRTDHVKQIMDPVLKDRQARSGGTDLVGFADIRRVLWPISRAVLNSNKKLTQNPGYSD
ncbi:MAG: RagB/SusD family nutrient uptake outer membrane protein [Mucilaginibacter sp.]|uniref:RagB/SusD family nutrient uptake outer membrane protein n=1 Tax=Mucilaginibacter sp. TaxID=1882438 RepID=UPI00326641CB